jgi:integrase
MASIKKQPNGRYRARYRDANGRSRSQTFDTKFAADRFLERSGADLQRGEWLDPALRRVRFEEWADAWWKTTVKLSRSTRQGYHKLLHNHVLPAFEGRAIGAIDFMDVEEFIADKLAAGFHPKFVRDMVSIVSLVMKGAVQARAIRENPAARHSIPGARRRKIGTGDVLTMAQIHRLIDVVDERYRLAVWILVFTGMRPAELCGLRVGDVDFARHRVHVQHALTPVHAFDDHPYQLVSGPPKTEAGNRILPLPDWLCDELAVMLAERAEQLGHPVPHEAPLFTASQSDRPLNRDAFRKHVVRPALVAAGLSPGFRNYDFRHTHASLLIDLGANVLAVARQLGHDPNVTLGVYGHLMDGVAERLTGRLDDLRASTTAAPATAAVVDLDEHRAATGTAGVADPPQDTRRTQQDTKQGSNRDNGGQPRTEKKRL